MSIDWDAPDPKPDFTPPQLVELRSLDDAMVLLGDWQRAYARLHLAYVKACLRAENQAALAENFELISDRLSQSLATKVTLA